MGTVIGFVGSGQMARALAGGFVKSGLVSGADVLFANPGDSNAEKFKQAVPGSVRLPDAKAVLDRADMIWLAVKPQVMESVVRPIADHLNPRHLLVSVAAGLTLPTLADWSGQNNIIRVMPNTPCLVGRGVSVYCCGASVSNEEKSSLHQLLGSVGMAREVPEKLIDPITGVSGCGPAFIMMFLEAMADGGVKAGVPRALAIELAIETLGGTAELLKQTGEHPAVLREQVSSPAGATIYGLSSLENSGVRGAISEAVFRAASRAKKLG